MELSTVIVVSPLVALMQYQAAQLTKKGVRAVFLQDVISETSNSPQSTARKCRSHHETTHQHCGTASYNMIKATSLLLLFFSETIK